MTDDKLAAIATQLKSSAHFVNHAQMSPYSEKQCIFLVLAGKKPVSQATSCKWVQTAGGAHSEPDNHQELGELLKQLGLAYQLRSDGHATDAFVSLNSEGIDAYLAAERTGDMATIGRLFGYPETAVEAFVKDENMDSDEQDRFMEAAGIPVTTVALPLFRFSKTHAAEELVVVKDWYEILKAYGLDRE